MDFRLQAFVSVARNLNFTRASRELHISQPAVSKHIQELETHYMVQLFEREGGKIRLTPSGEIFLRRAESIIESYRALGLEMNLQSGHYSGTLRIGASTTIAQYVLGGAIARFISRFPEIRLEVMTGNSEQIERALAEHRIELGVVESSSRHAGFRYAHMADDELVLVTSIHNTTPDEIEIHELTRVPLVLREEGSGTLEVIENSLAAHNLKLSQMNILMQMGSTEGIKSFLEECPSAYAIISVAAIVRELRHATLRIIDIKEVTIAREFALVTAQGAHNELAECFIEFITNNKKL